MQATRRQKFFLHEDGESVAKRLLSVLCSNQPQQLEKLLRQLGSLRRDDKRRDRREGSRNSGGNLMNTDRGDSKVSAAERTRGEPKREDGCGAIETDAAKRGAKTRGRRTTEWATPGEILMVMLSAVRTYAVPADPIGTELPDELFAF
jgi:hypothetical protein